MGRRFSSDGFWSSHDNAGAPEEATKFPALGRDLTEVDVVVVGAGIVGLSTARLLSQGLQDDVLVKGRQRRPSIVVLEGGQIGGPGSMTGESLGMLTTQLGTRFHTNLLQRLGAEHARSYVAELGLAKQWLIDTALECCGKEAVQRVDMVIYASRTRDNLDLQQEAHLARLLGVPGVRFQDTPLDLPVRNFGAMVVSDQAQLNPVVLLRQLSRSLVANPIPHDDSEAPWTKDPQVAIFESSRVVRVDEEPSGGLHELEVQCGDAAEGSVSRLFKVRARTVVLATGLPAIGDLHLKASPNSFPVIAARLPRAAAVANDADADTASDQAYPAPPAGLFMSAERTPNRVFRYSSDGTIVLALGKTFRPGQERQRRAFEGLESWLRTNFHIRKEETAPDPHIADWLGQDLRTVDSLPLVGPLTSNSTTLLGATGFGGWGLTSGVLAARVLSAHILGREFETAAAAAAAAVASSETPADLDRADTRISQERTGVAPGGGAVGTTRCGHHSLAQALDPRRNVSFLDRMLGLAMSPWTRLRDRLIGGPATSTRSQDLQETLSEIAPGSGRVILHKESMQQLAVFRPSDSGTPLVLRAVCTYRDTGTVAWNETDRTWDCPGHGCRFEVCGSVIRGPASNPLEAKELPPELTLGHSTAAQA